MLRMLQALSALSHPRRERGSVCGNATILRCYEYSNTTGSTDSYVKAHMRKA